MGAGASSTLIVDGNTSLQQATTSNLGVLSLAVASCDVMAAADGSLYCGTNGSSVAGFVVFEPMAALAAGSATWCACNSTATLNHVTLATPAGEESRTWRSKTRRRA